MHLFAAAGNRTPDLEHSIYRYEPPIGGDRPLSSNYPFATLKPSASVLLAPES